MTFATTASGPQPLVGATLVKLLPPAIALILVELLNMQVYHALTLPEFALWLVAIGSAVLVTGPLSDLYSRRRVLIGSHILGLGALAAIFLYGWTIYTCVGLALAYAPSPVARSAFLDSLRRHPRNVVLAIVLSLKFAPWCFYREWVSANPHAVLAILASLLLFNTLLLRLSFHSERWIKPARILRLPAGEMRRSLLCILVSLFLAEATFFLSDFLLRMGERAYEILPVLGIALVMGAMLHFLVRTSVLSTTLLRWTYGIGSALYFLSCLTFLFMKPTIYDVAILSVLICALGGFYLPIIYDLVLGWNSPRNKGMTCALMETTQYAACLITLGVTLVFPLSTASLMCINCLLFLGALLAQYTAEATRFSGLLYTLGKLPSEIS